MLIKKFPWRGTWWSDPSLWSLVVSNGVTLYLALKENWQLINVLWIFWFQSVIIGGFYFFRLLKLAGFSLEEIKRNNSIISTILERYFRPFFFAFHYGAFHLVYLFFLLTFLLNEESRQEMKELWGFIDFKYVLLMTLIFFLNHFFSFLYNYPQEVKQKQNINLVMLYPYARIIPMHFFIFLSAILKNSLLSFLLLKIIADVGMHIFEHQILWKREVR